MKKVKHILIILSCLYFNYSFSQCGPLTPSFTVNLVGQPNGTYTSPSVVRNDNCCGTVAPDICIKFTIFLDPTAMGINFNIASGAVPPGALFYQINCGPPVAVGSPICLNGPGPHILTFCKPGNNANSFEIVSIPAPTFPDSVLVRNGCSTTLAVTGFSVPTINWTSVFPGPNGTYNGYLNCVSGCASVIVTPTGTPPAFVDYQVGGFGMTPCVGNYYSDTIRVYFYNDLLAIINPTLTTLCFGQSNALLTGTATGGLPPYTYSWSTGSTNQTVTVGPGTYTLYVNDNTGCPPTTATAVVNSFSLPIAANAGPDQTLCKTSPNAVLNGTVIMASGGMWSGGTGTYSPAQNSLNITYIPTLAEVANGSVQLTFTTTGNAGCPPGSDVVVLNYQNPPIANAGPNATVCANNSQVVLAGSISGFSSTPQWSTAGNGVFSSTANLTPTYTPGPADIGAGFVNLTLTTANNGACPPASSTMQIIITPAPVVNAGANQTICSSNAAVLSGTITGPTITGFWTSSGSGSFSPSPNILNTNYFPSPSDISAGSVTLVLTSTGNGNCIAVTNSMIVSIIQIATVSASPSQSACSTTSSISITATVTGGTNTGTWSTSGSGVFSPGPGFLNNSYFISPGDVGAGNITFTISSTNNGPCPAVSNTLNLTIFQLATVNSGPNQALCSNAGTLGLNGIINTNTGFWTSNGTGTFVPNNAILNASYSISPADILAGSVTFTLTSANNGPCPVVQDTVKISIKTLAVVNSGSNQSICSSTGTVNLSGFVSGGSSTGIWSTNGNGAFNPGATSLNNTYFVSVSDIGMGVLIFTLTSLNNSPCPAVTDTMMLTIYQLATVNSGPNQALCANAGTLSLTGSVMSLSNTGVWTSTGTGTLNPDNTNLTPTYSITATDINAGSVTFTLASTNNGPCPAVRDTVKISIKKLALVDAGPDKTICSTSSLVGVTASVTMGSTSGIWSHSGGGNISPNNTALNISYGITQQDINTGVVNFVLTSLNNGVCPAVLDTCKIIIIENPVIKLSGDTTICSYQNPVKIYPNISGDFGQLQWSSNGSGSFIPNNMTNPVTYDITGDIPVGQVVLSIATLSNGPCANVSASIRVTIRKSPDANFTPSTYTANIPNDPVSFSNQSTNSNSYYWNFGDGTFSNLVSPIHNFSEVGYYNVNLIAINQYGCSDTINKEILVISDIQFPNVFTPNTNGSNGGVYSVSDLSNDIFFPYTSGVTEYNLKIFNRWGELIFESNDIKIGWDGYFKSKLCQQDGYVWKADVQFFDGRKYNKTGSVTLLR